MITSKHPEISIVIPAYNEEKRLPEFLREVIDFTAQSRQRYEIIVVDDGSRDRTFEVTKAFMARQEGVDLIRLEVNRGKGHAVKHGLFKARGDVRVFLDADGSVHPREIERCLPYFEQGYDVIIGSRVKHGAGQKLERRWWRVAMGVVFNFLVNKILNLPFLDTQCGFKMFRAYVVKPVFSRLYLHRFGFDIELLFLVYRCGFKAVEVPVSWTHKTGSKVNLVADSLKMLVNIFQVYNWHWTPINVKDKYLGPNEFAFMYGMENDHWWFTSRRETLKSLVAQAIRAAQGKAVILDAGCGTGANLEMLSMFGETSGVDASERAISFCRKRGLQNVLCAPLEALPYNDAMFHVVVLADVLEHVEDPARVLQALSHVMKPGGKLIVMAPAFKTLWSQHDEALCHFRRYSKDELKSTLEDGGFSVERIGFLFFLSFFVVAPIRLLRRLFVKRSRWVSDTSTLPPPMLNRMLHGWFVLEYRISRIVPLPFGTSLYVIARKS